MLAGINWRVKKQREKRPHAAQALNREILVCNRACGFVVVSLDYGRSRLVSQW